MTPLIIKVPDITNGSSRKEKQAPGVTQAFLIAHSYETWPIMFHKVSMHVVGYYISGCVIRGSQDRWSIKEGKKAKSYKVHL